MKNRTWIGHEKEDTIQGLNPGARRGEGKKSYPSQRLDDKGMVLIVVLFVIIILTILGFGASRNAIVDTMASSTSLSSVKTFYAAEAGAVYGFNQLWKELQKAIPNTGGITPPIISGYTISHSSYVSAVGNTAPRMTTGIFAGLTAFIQRYRITSVATETAGNGKDKVVMEVDDQLIPIFQFGIFYHDDLEISAGVDLSLKGGRIHSNRNAYFSAANGKTLSIDSIITSAGSIYRSGKAGGSMTGTVQIMDTASAYHALTYDSTSASWVTQSQTDWGGRVKNDVHGATSLSVPMPAGGNVIDVLGTGPGSMHARSGLRIMNGIATNKNNGTVTILYSDPNYKDKDGRLIVDPGATAQLNVNPISYGGSHPVFYDAREKKTMTALEIDLAKLQKSPNAMAALADPPSGGYSGILYISSDNMMNPVVRITNGSVLDSTKLPQGLSIATDNPLYVKGSYNTTNRPAGFYADAFTVLSDAWDDGRSSQPISSRTATDITVNGAIMAGNRNTSGADYSGGAENFIRFLEDWSGKTMIYRGSLACLWQSRQSTAKWPGTGSVYVAPMRNWSYGIPYNNLPPSTPRVRNIVKLGWRHGHGAG